MNLSLYKQARNQVALWQARRNLKLFLESTAADYLEKPRFCYPEGTRPADVLHWTVTENLRFMFAVRCAEILIRHPALCREEPVRSAIQAIVAKENSPDIRAVLIDASALSSFNSEAARARLRELRAQRPKESIQEIMRRAPL